MTTMRVRWAAYCMLVAATAGAALAQSQSAAPVIASSSVAVVNTEAGKVQGFVHHGIYTYRGVPYARAARFMAPEKPDHWEGTRTALSYGYICPQVQAQQLSDIGEFLIEHRYWITNENCQNLNVWTPGIDDGKKRPVMVWLHGGAFTNGSSIEQAVYDGENLSRKGDVVVVSVNHRVNALGFLDLSAYGPQYKNSANAGIMDLVAALDWVRTNIANFGGDPSNVTIFGQSGGGGKVTTLMGTPAAKGLFEKAIVESGGNLGMVLIEPRVSRRIAQLTLDNLHLDASKVDQLQTIQYEYLYEASQRAFKAVAQETGAKAALGPALMWGPVHDGSFLPNQPYETAASPLSKNVSLLIGTTLNEFDLSRADPDTRGSEIWTMDQMRTYLEKRHGDKAGSMIAAFRKAYPDMKYNDWIHIDSMFRPSEVAMARMKSDQHGAPVYNYLFAWQSPVLNGVGRADHCAEIPFAFDNVALDEQGSGGGADAYALQGAVSQAWINFARSGNPNNPELPKWPAFTRDNEATMILDNSSQVRYKYDQDLLDLMSPEWAF